MTEIVKNSRTTLSGAAESKVMVMQRVLVCLAITGLAGCPAAGEDIQPPRDQLFFPTGLTVAPDSSVLFVANANSELRYNSGSISVIDLDAVQSLTDTWATGSVPGGDCNVDASRSHVLECNEAEVVNADSTIRIGNFATALATQTLDSGALRLFAAVRGDPSVTWVDYDDASQGLDCGGVGSYPLCNNEHRLAQLRNDAELPGLNSEPFGIHVDSLNGYVMVTHLTSGAVSLVDAPTDGSQPILADAIAGLFLADQLTGVRGAVGVAGRLPGSDNDLVYVTSRSEERVQMLYVHRSESSPYPTIVPSEYFFLDQVFPSDDGRGIAFSADGQRTHIVNRQPPTLSVLDTSLDEQGFPTNELVGVVEVCTDASNVTIADPGAGERAYITCFPSGEVWVVNPFSMIVEAIIEVGRGPHAVTVSVDRKQMYVANFLEDTVAVIDVEPGSPTENLVVLRLGRTRQSGGN
jgi:DNA-binding beta-propeller fold protein YncE